MTAADMGQPECSGNLNEHARRIKYLCLHGMLAVDGIEYIIRRMREMVAGTARKATAACSSSSPARSAS